MSTPASRPSDPRSGGCPEAPCTDNEAVRFNPIQQRLPAEEPTERCWPATETTDPWGITGSS